MSDFSVSIIGTGRVARSLAHAFTSNSIQVNEIYGRSIEPAQALADNLADAKSVNQLDFSDSYSTIFIIAISDDAIEAVANQIKIPDGAVLAHTSGTVSQAILKHQNAGVFYPLQTFTNQGLVDFMDVPLLIDGSNDPTIAALKSLAESISKNVQITTEKERQQLHVAAVFASNFTNRMLAASEEILKGTSMDLKVLEPLVVQSVKNAFDSGPDQALTGPAKRRDTATIDKHLAYLMKESPHLLEIYKTMTDAITDQNLDYN